MKVTPFKDLVKRMPKEVQAAGKARYQELRQDVLLKELRESLKITQAQVAKKTGIKGPNVSRLERQHDMQIATLRKIIAALGGKLEIIARFDDTTVRLAF